VTSNDPREGLLDHLVKANVIDGATAEPLRRFAERGEVTLSGALVERGAVDPDTLSNAAASLARRRLLTAFAWPDGQFSFSESKVLPEPGDQPIDVVGLLIQAAARVTPMDVCIAFLLEFHGQVLKPSDWAPRYGARYDRVFGSPNPREILDAAPDLERVHAHVGDRDKVARQVFGLVCSGLAAFAAPDPAEQRRSSGRVVQIASAPDEGDEAPDAGARRYSVPTQSARARPRSTNPLPQPPPIRRATPHGTPIRRTPEKSPVQPAAPQQKTDTAQMPTKVRASFKRALELADGLGKKTHYEVLGLERGASADEVRKGFRALARDFHVDRFARYKPNPEDTKRIQQVFMAINTAHEILTDDSQRKEYDLSLEMADKGVTVKSQGGGADVAAVFRAEQLVREALKALNHNVDAAHEKFERALAVTPNDVLGNAGHAYAEFLIGQRSGASPDGPRKRLEAIVAEHDHYDLPCLYLGIIYRNLDDTKRAIQCFNMALRANERCAEARSELRLLQKRNEEKPKRGLFGRRK
jgi:hypothetical protein